MAAKSLTHREEDRLRGTDEAMLLREADNETEALTGAARMNRPFGVYPH